MILDLKESNSSDILLHGGDLASTWVAKPHSACRGCNLPRKIRLQIYSCKRRTIRCSSLSC